MLNSYAQESCAQRNHSFLGSTPPRYTKKDGGLLLELVDGDPDKGDEF